ncbi:hypothetical protein JCM16358_09340 [Halanaerocella petrolearia]
MFRRDKGYVLVLVLIILLGLGIVISGLVRMVGNEVVINNNYNRQIKDYYLLQGAMKVVKQEVKSKLEELDYVTDTKLAMKEEVIDSFSLEGPDVAEEIKIEYKVKEIIDESSKLNLNLVTQERLEELPSLSQTLSQRIVDNRPYNYLVELKQLEEVGSATYQDIKQYGTISSTSNKVNINTASLKMLETLPGIGETLAGKIISQVPFSSKEQLKKVSGIGDDTYKKVDELVQVDSNSFQISIQFRIPAREVKVVKKEIINLK